MFRKTMIVLGYDCGSQRGTDTPLDGDTSKAREIVMFTFRTLQPSRRDAFSVRSGVGNEFVEPTAPACNRATRIARFSGLPIEMPLDRALTHSRNSPSVFA
jgi:hypothetical protein